MNKRCGQTEEHADTRVSIGDPFAKRLMVCYLKRRETDIESLRSNLAGEDFASIATKGHNLYGSGSAYGLDEVSRLGADLEKAANRGDAERIAQLIDALDAFIRKVRVV